MPFSIGSLRLRFVPPTPQPLHESRNAAPAEALPQKEQLTLWAKMLRVLSFAAVLATGCSRFPHGGDDLLRLSAAEFNAEGASWRALETRGEYLSAARLLEMYIERNIGTLSEDDIVLLHFHTAQEFAFAGHSARALSHLLKSRYTVEPLSVLRWNDYVSATEAFLKRDRPALLRARERIAGAPKWNGETLSLNVVDALVEHFDEPYRMAYIKATKRPSNKPASSANN